MPQKLIIIWTPPGYGRR